MKRSVVAKFGGASVQDAIAIRKIAQILKKNSQIGFVIFSAVRGITDALVKFCQTSALEKETILTKIYAKHLDIAKNLNVENECEERIKNCLAKIKKYNKRELSTKEMDEVISTGEDLALQIIYQFLKSEKITVIFIDARKIIITDDNFGQALPDFPKIKEAITKQLTKIHSDTIILTQGFIGSNRKNETTTLGRGGSDFSAAIIAEATAATNLAIYTDVEGLYTMDPKIVSSARLISTISFQEMAEMANFGAKILHPATLIPCIRRSIPVTILSSLRPNHGKTYIDPCEEKYSEKSPLIRAITMRKRQILVTIKSLQMLNSHGFLANIFTILAKHKISVDLITTSEVSVALTIDSCNANSHNINPFANQKLIEELEQFAKVIIENDLTLVAIIGKKLAAPGLVAKILHLFGKNFIRLICYGASCSNIAILVKNEKADEIAKILHKKLVEKDKYSEFY